MDSDGDSSEISDTCSSLSLQYSSSPFEYETSTVESDDVSDAGRVEPYQYEPEISDEAENTVDESGADFDGDGDESRREWLSNTDW